MFCLPKTAWPPTCRSLTLPGQRKRLSLLPWLPPPPHPPLWWGLAIYSAWIAFSSFNVNFLTFNSSRWVSATPIGPKSDRSHVVL